MEALLTRDLLSDRVGGIYHVLSVARSRTEPAWEPTGVTFEIIAVVQT
jgi:hypothetical protein